MKMLFVLGISIMVFVQIGLAQEGSAGAKSPEAGNAYNDSTR